ncbi:MAG TPA: transketolase [Acidimicrobiia bacterium]|jgi:transketolase|nr:transketolase [Acidimicrobiia bacterium]
MPETPPVEQLAVDTLKALAMDAVQKANSGHPGMPMGMADIAVTLWSRFLKVDPDHPTWPDRDRFVVSNGHGSMLLYGLLHLSGFDVSLDAIKNFRQWGYHTAGHPEVDQSLGIETTTGPLGQGFGTAVGMAIAEAHLRARLGSDLVDHHTYAFVSDGDLMEGVSSESASLAGSFGLGRLIYFYDDNEISIDGSTDITFLEDVPRRFDAFGWHTVEIDGHDRGAVAEAVEAALKEEDRPSLIDCHTHIAHGAPTLEGTAKAHGNPLGEEELTKAKEAMGYPTEPAFWVDESVYEFFGQAMERGRAARKEWKARFDAADTAEWEAMHSAPPIRLDGPVFESGEGLATRASSGQLFSEIAAKVPGFIGGAADLVESTKTVIEKGRLFSREDPAARDIAFGIREHAMGTAVNGMALHGGLRPYGATFFVFSDYMRPAVRLSALMQAPSIWVWTHDSVFLGEDGPTHQPIEHLASLRAMPNIWVIRPADAHEVVSAWEVALNRNDGPVALVLTRQNVPTLEGTGEITRGGYVVRGGDDVTLIATGSEVSTAVGAADLLEGDGVSARVVSLPCWELFQAQPADYRREILGSSPRVSIEAAATFGWEQIVGQDGLVLGIDHFGASAPAEVIAEQFGFTPDAVAAKVKAHLGK